MINKKDLRIGNVYRENGVRLFVSELLEDEIICMVSNDSHTVIIKTRYENAQPEMLAPEILEKCGFIKNVTWDLGMMSIIFAGEDSYWINGRIYYNSWAIRQSQPKYLHDLQNLYFVLTGKELEIKL